MYDLLPNLPRCSTKSLLPPVFTLAHELYPGKFRPTITHAFVRLLSEHGLLHTCFTQNIDTLERRAGVPADKIIEAHGSFADQHCIGCQANYDGKRYAKSIRKKEIVYCDHCPSLVKPDIVFFGESVSLRILFKNCRVSDFLVIQLPPSFFQGLQKTREADLLIVIGTSLTVYPFAGLANRVSPNTPRVLINLDQVGDFGSEPDDVILLGKCDDIVAQLCRALGWEAELIKLWKDCEAVFETPEDTESEEAGETAQLVLEENVESLVERIGKSLVIGEVTDTISKKQADSEPSTVDTKGPHYAPQEKPEAASEVKGDFSKPDSNKDASTKQSKDRNIDKRPSSLIKESPVIESEGKL